MRISDWSSDVCSSDLGDDAHFLRGLHRFHEIGGVDRHGEGVLDRANLELQSDPEREMLFLFTMAPLLASELRHRNREARATIPPVEAVRIRRPRGYGCTNQISGWQSPRRSHARKVVEHRERSLDIPPPPALRGNGRIRQPKNRLG